VKLFFLTQSPSINSDKKKKDWTTMHPIFLT